VNPGDQLRARGVRSADGASFTADEVVTGSVSKHRWNYFVRGRGRGNDHRVRSCDEEAGGREGESESQLRKLPPQMAQMIAMRLKGAAAGTPAAANSLAASDRTGGCPRRTGTQWRRRPAAIIGSTSGSPVIGISKGRRGDDRRHQWTERRPSYGQSLSWAGVEPLLQATTREQASSILTPWSLSNGGGDAAQ